MAQIVQPLLTIAIPTFNRAELLTRNLDSISKSIIGFENFVEVIISDNFSSDNTEDVVNKFSKCVPIKYFKNVENIGFNYNYIKIVEEYACGDFCWILGDDDFIRIGAIEYILDVIQSNPDTSFFSLSFDTTWTSNSISKLNLNYNYRSFDSYKKMLNNLIIQGNIFSGFISASIFKTKPLKILDKGFISPNSFELPYYNMFPHSCYFALSFKENKSIIIDDVLFYANNDQIKGWEFALSQIYLVIFPFIYKYHLSLGFGENNLSTQKELIFYNGNSFFVKNVSSFKNYKFRLKYLKFAVFDKLFYKVLFRQIIKFVLK